MKVKIRKGDIIEVISGGFKDKGKRGAVIKVSPKKGRVTAQGIIYARSIRARFKRKGAV